MGRGQAALVVAGSASQDRVDILGGNVEMQLCRFVHDKNTNKYVIN